jgi:hypothetical protein
VGAPRQGSTRPLECETGGLRAGADDLLKWSRNAVAEPNPTCATCMATRSAEWVIASSRYCAWRTRAAQPVQGSRAGLFAEAAVDAVDQKVAHPDIAQPVAITQFGGAVLAVGHRRTQRPGSRNGGLAFAVENRPGVLGRERAITGPRPARSQERVNPTTSRMSRGSRPPCPRPGPGRRVPCSMK